VRYIKEDSKMRYWMDVLRGEWGVVENPYSVMEPQSKERVPEGDNLREIGQPVASIDTSLAWILSKERFLAAFDYLEHHACWLTFSSVSPFL
jgi:hypothetical protein